MENTTSGSRPSRISYLLAGGVTFAFVMAGLAVGPARPPGLPPGGRALPRVPQAPADVPTLLRQLGVGSFTWYACAVAVPLLWWCAGRWPITQPRVLRAVATQAGILLAMIGATSVVHYLFTYRGAPLAPGFWMFVPVALGHNALALLAVAAAVNALELGRRAVRGTVEAERLRAELAESRLLAVTSQLQPHFLFNTLQSISTLIHRDPDAADAMLARLSDLLRDVLRRSKHALVPLADELQMTGTYLELARLRFGERLSATIDVEEGVRAAMVPVLLFQPFIENAIRHGIGPRATGGRLGITVRRNGERLAVTIWDDGVGPGPSWHEGTGLSNARERLAHAFGPDQSLQLGAREEGGTVVTIDLPIVAVSSSTAA